MRKKEQKQRQTDGKTYSFYLAAEINICVLTEQEAGEKVSERQEIKYFRFGHNINMHRKCTRIPVSKYTYSYIKYGQDGSYWH